MPTKYEVIIEAKDNASSVFQRVVENATRTGGDIDKERVRQERSSEQAIRQARARSEQDSSKTAIQRVKQQFGEDSQFGLIGKTLIGTGAIAGVSVILNQLEKASAKAAELANQFRAGKITAGELTDNLIGSLPVLGQAYSFTRNIEEALTGSKAQAEKLAEALGQVQEAADKASQSVTDRGKFQKDLAGQFGDAAKGRAADALRREGLAGSGDVGEIRAKREAELRAQLDGIKERFKAEIQSLSALETKQRGIATQFLNNKELTPTQQLSGWNENQDAANKTMNAREAAARAQVKAIADARAESTKATDNDVKNRLGAKSLADVNALGLGKKFQDEFRQQFGKTLQDAAKDSLLGKFVDEFGKGIVGGIEKQRGGFMTWLAGAKDRAESTDLHNTMQRSLADEQAKVREGLLRNTGRGDLADQDALKRDRDRDVEQIQQDAEKKLRDTNLDKTTRDDVVKNRDELVAARQQQFGQDAIALAMKSFMEQRPSTTFDVQESRHLTGVQSSGQDTQRDQLQVLQEIAKAIADDPANKQKIGEALEKLSKAADGNQLIIASLK